MSIKFWILYGQERLVSKSSGYSSSLATAPMKYHTTNTTANQADTNSHQTALCVIQTQFIAIMRFSR